jgi:hypothetical protein
MITASTAATGRSRGLRTRHRHVRIPLHRSRRLLVEDTGAMAPNRAYLHVDVDMVDPRDLPGQLFPLPTAPACPPSRPRCATFVASCDVVAVGLACIWQPGSGADRGVADIAGEPAAVPWPPGRAVRSRSRGTGTVALLVPAATETVGGLAHHG